MEGSIDDLVLQALETEQSGANLYARAVQCACHEALRDEWQKYLDQTRRHVSVLRTLCTTLSIDPDADTHGRRVVRHLGESLVAAIDLAAEGDSPTALERTACECVVLAETKDHLNWSLLARYASSGDPADAGADAIRQASDEVEAEEGEHLYHTRGWCRELWLQALGLPAVLPPPEEQRLVTTALGAAHAEIAGHAADTASSTPDDRADGSRDD